MTKQMYECVIRYIHIHVFYRFIISVQNLGGADLKYWLFSCEILQLLELLFQCKSISWIEQGLNSRNMAPPCTRSVDRPGQEKQLAQRASEMH